MPWLTNGMIIECWMPYSTTFMKHPQTKSETLPNLHDHFQCRMVVWQILHLVVWYSALVLAEVIPQDSLMRAMSCPISLCFPLCSASYMSVNLSAALYTCSNIEHMSHLRQ